MSLSFMQSKTAYEYCVSPFYVVPLNEDTTELNSALYLLWSQTYLCSLLDSALVGYKKESSWLVSLDINS